MNGPWLQDIESLEEISQDEETRQIFLNLAAMQQTGRISTFIVELEHDPAIDEATKGTLTELAQDRAFLQAVEEYCHRTLVEH